MVSLVPLLFISIAIGSAATILAWRARPEPGAKPLVALLVAQSWWSTCIIFKLRAATLDMKLLWANLAWIGVVTIPVAWFFFALEYTGRDEYLRPRYVGALSVIPVLTVVLSLTGQYHDLLYIQPTGTSTNGVMLVEQGGPWFWIIAAYTYILGIFGMIPILGLLTSDAVAFRGQSAALVIGLLAPWVTNILFLAGSLPTAGVDPTPIAFSVSGIVYLAALTRFRLLGTSPAPNKRARQFLFDRMQGGAIVVDANDYVVDLNDSCVEILGVDPREVLGSSAREIIPEYDRLPDDGALPGHLTIGDELSGHPYDVVSTQITNVNGTAIGRVITFHDIGEHLRQQQRLEVLNRVLRHNIRTETNVIYGYISRFEDNENARTVKERALRIEEIGKKGREAIELFDKTRDGTEPVSLDALLTQCLTSVCGTEPAVTVQTKFAHEDVEVAGLLRPVFSNIIENAVEHNTNDDPHVWITTHVEGTNVHVEVADNGPGIAAYELAVLEDGTETPLKHGSGLGLWIVKWGTDIASGDVRFTENDPDGSVVTVEVPVLSQGHPSQVAE
ncbi:histidine kinase N-terminal 7TM domain-containing protein [Haloferax marinisediminis]|uniref:histidine kinase N-terminal 7TM domain-containing protein n=1 Tax=Haloferax marinisediminis TaxID=2666142 RepID=UPI001CDA038E|nr:MULTISPECIES: histidine kinase N-terminal 7TM domain-containing protein [Haloferax]